MSPRARALVAIAGTVLLAVVAAGSMVLARSRLQPASAGPAAVRLTSHHRLVARSTATATRGRVISVPTDDPHAPQLVSTVTCLRVYAVVGRGACLRQDGDLPTYQLAVLGTDLKVADEIPLVGVPNRTRVSPSGRWVAWTVFVAGDSYNGGHFSTRAGMLDLSTHELVDSLEDYDVLRDGQHSRPRDRNFWGVTFAADDRRFYATMSTAGTRWLVEGDVTTRTMRLLRPNVECPLCRPTAATSPSSPRRAATRSAGGGCRCSTSRPRP